MSVKLCDLVKFDVIDVDDESKSVSNWLNCDIVVNDDCSFIVVICDVGVFMGFRWCVVLICSVLKIFMNLCSCEIRWVMMWCVFLLDMMCIVCMYVLVMFLIGMSCVFLFGWVFFFSKVLRNLLLIYLRICGYCRICDGWVIVGVVDLFDFMFLNLFYFICVVCNVCWVWFLM